MNEDVNKQYFSFNPSDSRATGPEDVAGTVLQRYGTGGNQTPLVVEEKPMVYSLDRTSCNCGYELDRDVKIDENLSATLLSTGPNVVCYRSSPYDSKTDTLCVLETEVATTLDCTGANPSCKQGGTMVVSLEGNGQRPSHKGDGYSDKGVMFTLNSVEQHAVAYLICATNSFAMQGDNPYVGIREEKHICRTLDNTCCHPACNQGGIAIVEEKPRKVCVFNGENITHPLNSVRVDWGDPCHTLHSGSRHILVEEVVCLDMGGGKSTVSVLENCSPTLSCTHYGAPVVAYGVDLYNVSVEEEKTMSIRCKGDNEHIPCVIKECYSADAYNGDINDKAFSSLRTNCGSVTGSTQVVIAIGHDERSSQMNDVADPLTASDYKQPQVVCYALDRASFNQGKNAQWNFEINDKISPPLMHKGPGGVCTPIKK